MEGQSVQGLHCQESETCLDEDLAGDDMVFIDLPQSCRDSDREEEDLKVLAERETNFGFKVDQSGVFQNWIKYARLEAIEWIMKSRAIFGFRPQTAYLSVLYFDRFLSRRSIDAEKLWAVRLLSVACLSLAAKMEEIKIPSLSDFQIEDYNFENKLIQRMELLVLSTLEWKMTSVTPFSFLHHYFIRFCKEESQSKLMLRRTVELIMTVMREIKLTDHRPSVIAVAATLVALDQGLTRIELERKMNAVLCSHLFVIEDVFQWYALIQKLAAENLKWPKAVRSQTTHFRLTDVSGHSCAKRKELASDGSEESNK